MAIITEVIRVEDNGTLSFGNFEAKDKQKADDFLLNGNTYSVRTYKDVTRIEKNKELLMETIPGAAIHNFHKDESGVNFTVEGFTNTNITVQLNNDTLYRITCGKSKLGSVKSNLSGKMSFSLDISDKKPQNVTIEKL